MLRIKTKQNKQTCSEETQNITRDRPSPSLGLGSGGVKLAGLLFLQTLSDGKHSPISQLPTAFLIPILKLHSSRTQFPLRCRPVLLG